MTFPLLFVGMAWQGSSARSLGEALAAQPAVVVADVAQDAFIPSYRSLRMRVLNRLLHRWQRAELEATILRQVASVTPSAVVIYKGYGITGSFVRALRTRGVATVNVFPDYSPHAYGSVLREAMGCYDLVISTKPFHPRLWRSVYGYDNACVFVPHGYDPAVHYVPAPPPSPTYDVTLCANWRPEYHRLMRGVADRLDPEVSVAVAGLGWGNHRADFPAHWTLLPPQTGPAYTAFLRAGRIVLAPVHREVRIGGKVQPGDEDTIRTYELAAAHCFFIHQRTAYIPEVYDEATEVPFWSDAAEIAALVRRWLPDEAGRRTMAGRAHRRAVPAYSLPARAAQVLAHVRAIRVEA
jgi:hypothetical protein